MAGRQSHHGHRRTGLCVMPSRELVTVSSQQRLMASAALLVAVQVVHAVLPGSAEGGGSVVGPVGGVILLVAAVVAWVGAWQRRPWARLLLPWTGALVAVGFLLYHALPVRSPLTHPYWGRRDVGWMQWLPVLAAIAVGVWCAVAGAARQTSDRA
jgi:hypothetical protein